MGKNRQEAKVPKTLRRDGEALTPTSKNGRLQSGVARTDLSGPVLAPLVRVDICLPSIVPGTGVYFVVDAFGSHGRAWRETDLNPAGIDLSS